MTFPNMPDPLIPRNTLIKWLHDRFSAERRVIVIRGADGTGKTTLLAQFAKSYPDRCFSFFVGKSYWDSRPLAFLRELCTQMQMIVTSKETEIEGDFYEIRELFGRLYYQIARKARRQKKSFYFVIDGLEWVPERSGPDKNIIDLLPCDPRDGVYLLISSAPGRDFDFDHHVEPIQLFSPPATESYLEHIGINDIDAVEQIYDACGGMPGYLAQIHRELRSGISVDEVLTSLPSGFQELLEREWERAGVTGKDDDILISLAIIAHSQSPLSTQDLAGMIGIEKGRFEEQLASVPQVQLIPNEQSISFVTDAHRRFVTNKLDDYMLSAYKALIGYYKREPLSKSSQNQLPILYKRMKRFDALKSYVSADNLIRMLQETQDLSLLRRNVQMVAREAYTKEEWQVLAQYALMSSILRELSTKSALESEIEALLALGDYEESADIAFQAVLPEDRLQLLARIGSYMKQRDNLPISPDMRSDLERMVSEIEPRDRLRQRVIEIAADLFYVHPQAAKDLVERVARVDASGRLMDVILAVLTLRLEGEAARSAETLRSRISDQSLQDFARVNSPIVADFTPEQVLAEAEELQDTSGKLFLLRSWCNANRENPRAIRVVIVALEIMTASTDYAPSMRHLRQFAEPLLVNEEDEVYELVDRFDLLKDTAIGKPADEAVRLELLLASIEVKRSEEKAHKRLLDTYLKLVNIPELDIRCYCLTRILLSLHKIDPDDSLRMEEEIEENLPAEYENLLAESASHWTLTRKLLRALTNHKPKMAIEFAGKLNTIDRRDRAYREILQVYTDRAPQCIDLSFIEDVFSKISERARRDWALVEVLARFAEKDLFSRLPHARESVNRHFIDEISNIQAPRRQSLAYAHAISMMSSAEKKKEAGNLYKKMIDAWSSIDQRWRQVQTGFDLAAIVADKAPELAREVLKLTRKKRATTPLAQDSFVELYINVLKLAIRAFPDIIKSQDYSEDRRELIKAIDFVPSCAIQAQLIADLALHHPLPDKEPDFQDIVEKDVLPRLESCEDAEAYINTVIQIAPCLFQYERELLRTKLSELSPSQRDRALGNVVSYLLSNRPPSDPVDLNSLNVRLDYLSALRACETIAQMSSDSATYSYLSCLVNQLVQTDRRNPKYEKCVLIERNAVNIAKELKKIVDNNFPDSDNIQHEGYLIASQSSIARLRDAATHDYHRAEQRWRRVAPTWADISQAAQGMSIPNAADRAIVMAWVGKDMYMSKPKMAKELLEKSRDCIDEIPNIIDRSGRLQALANSWQQVDDEESAKHFIEEGMSILEAWDWDQTRDQVTGQFLELAHSLDPEFAASLTSTVDNPLIRYGLEQDMASRNLKSQPDKLEEHKLDIPDLQYLTGKTAYRLLRSLCSGKGLAQQRKVVGQWMYFVIDAQFEEVYNVMAWAIENNLAQTQALHAPSLGATYSGLLDSLQMIWRIGNLLLGVERHTGDLQHRIPALPPSLQLFSVGSQDEAIDFLQDWLMKNAEGYVKIYDPYFDVVELDVLRGIPVDVRVHVLTSWKAQGVFDDPDIARRYKDAWNQISDSQPPETHFYVLGTREKNDSPMHNRYYITAESGLEISTSRSGLGRKDSSVRYLKTDEAARIESEFVDQLIVNPPLYFKEERLIVHTFTL